MGNKIKILQVIHGMHYGGAENVVFNIIKKINTDKFDVSICCVNFIGDIGEVLNEEGFKIHVLESGIGVVNTLNAVKDIIFTNNIDVVHTHGIPAFLAVAPLCVFQKNIKWMHTYHFGNYPHIAKKYLYAQKILSRFAKQLVAVSESQKRAVLKYLSVKENKLTVVFNGVSNNPCLGNQEERDSYRSEFGYTNDDFVVASIVVLGKQKGITYLIQSVDAIVKKNSNVKILIVGGGPLEEELKDQASKLAFSESIKFTGWRKDISEIMNAIDLFVLPSLWEGLPMVLLEAMSSRLPVVVTDIADNANVVNNGEAGILVPPKDPDALADSILKVANDESYAKQLADNAYHRYNSQYAVEKMISNYENIYLDLMAAKQ